MMTDIVSADSPADSAPAPDETPFDLDALAEKDPVAFEEWQATGTLPGDTTDSTPSPADSAPATPDQQAASTGAIPDETPASDPGAPAEQLPDGTKAETAGRFQELLADRAAERLGRETAERELRDLKAKRTETGETADPPPAPASDEKPQQKDYDNYEEFIVKLSAWGARQEHVKLTAKATKEQRVDAHFASFREVQQAATVQLEQAEAADPEFSKQIDPRLLEVAPASLCGPDDTISAQNVIVDEMLRSERLPDFLKYFSAKPSEFDRLSALQNPMLLMRALGFIEAGFAGVEPEPIPTSPNSPISRAPAPPETLGRRTVEETDPVKSALDRDDPAAYILAANQRDAANLKAE